MTDGSQPLSGRVMCEHYWLSVLMYTPGMSVMSLLLKNRYEMKREIDFFYRKRKCFCFFSFPKKGSWLFASTGQARALSKQRRQCPRTDVSGVVKGASSSSLYLVSSSRVKLPRSSAILLCRCIFTIVQTALVLTQICALSLPLGLA